jgi:hypothetical protein
VKQDEGRKEAGRRTVIGRRLDKERTGNKDRYGKGAEWKKKKINLD